MISSSRRLNGQAFATCNSKLSRPYICARCRPSSTQCSSFPLILGKRADGLRSRRATGQRAVVSGHRGFQSGKIYHFPSLGVLLDDKSREAFQTELERKDDIYSYLFKWKDNPTAPNIDPIMPPELRHGEATESKWVGNMLHEHIVQRSENEFMYELEHPQYSTPKDYENSPFLQPGDVVLMKSTGNFADGCLAVYIRTIDEQLQFYTSRGRWLAVRHTELSLMLNERAAPELTTPLLPYFPTSTVEIASLPQFALEGGVPRPLGAPLMTLMSKIESEAREFYNKHAADLCNIYAKLAAKDTYTIMTLDEIAKKALNRDPDSLTNPQRYAIHKALQRYPFYIMPNQTASTVESYRIRSMREFRVIDDVVRLMRSYDNGRARETIGLRADSLPITGFLQKARQLVAQSRQLRTPTDSFSLGPAAGTSSDGGYAISKTPVHLFTGVDRVIINFLLLWTIPRLYSSRVTLNTIGSSILRATELYNDYPLTPATGYLFLQELGVLSPWENLYLFGEQLELPGHGFQNTSDQLTTECAQISAQLGPNSLVDSMKDLRKDWGDLPVFCIDSADAGEIDDGVSIEPTVESPETFWIRIHVANPSSFVPPDHKFAQAAAHFQRSFYAPERSYPMLPPTLTHDRFSLAPGRPTLTISAKVNLGGDILETEITSGRVNNVVYATPEAVQRLFGVDRDNVPVMDLTVGDRDSLREKARPGLQNHLQDEHQESLRTLQKILSARRDKRVEKGATDSNSPRKSTPVVSASGEALPRWPVEYERGYQHDGEPTIQLSHRLDDPFEVVDSTKGDLVSHAMMLAGEVAAQWCKERGIPVMFSGSAYRDEGPTPNSGKEEEKPTSLKKSLGFSSSRPTPHATLGMDQYTKCTSPLRRYSDLVAHWQIEASLRGEEKLPFSEGDVKTLIARTDWQDRLKDHAESRSQAFWTCQLLHRALNFSEIALPETFQCLVVTDLLPVFGKKAAAAEKRYLGAILPFRLRCMVVAPEDIESFQPGDLVDVKLTDVHVYDTLVTVSAVRLAKRPEEGTVPPENLWL